MKLINYMPQFLKNVREFNEIFNAEDFELEFMREQIDKILKEVIVNTAESYGLERYEKIYGITNIAETIEARRMNILFKINNRVPFTLKWLINTLNASIGAENYKLSIKDYVLHIEIALNYTEAAEMLKSNLVYQIPANIQLDYELTSQINEYIGAVVSQQSYLDLYAIAIESTENLVLEENNNVGLNLSRQDYMEIDSNTDTTKQMEEMTLNSEAAIKTSRQDYMELSVDNDTSIKAEDIISNAEVGLAMSRQDYINIEEVEK